ncbi:MAG: 2-oxo-4-hydroxy-4-carboxy-5-ureidoimidazoline decarboxylase [Burkholderiales bacterium]|nr:2-oxo-4-hydroxy-4-carboxy-5-ureidoimidazoline decarboxylase [Burkholderiales bacterium]
MNTTPALTLAPLNAADQGGFTALLSGVYEHSPWIAEHAWAQRPFKSLPHLKHALAQVVRQAPPDAQLGLIRAHPELAGKAAVAGQMTAESSHEQSQAGLSHCTPEEFALLHQLNQAYKARFGWPFILAVRGPRGTGLSRPEIISTFQRRLQNHPDFERAECLRHIHRIAEVRLNDKFGLPPRQGELVWDWAQALTHHTEGVGDTASQLTVTYLTPAHQACARQLQTLMQDCGFDEVSQDAVGNVVGRYHGTQTAPPWLLTGSHFDTVRNGGKYDGRLGILVPMACVRQLHQRGQRLPFGIEVVGFAEEEGQRYKAAFLGSSALVGDFNPAWLDLADAGGITMRQAMRDAGLPGTMDAIQALQRDPAHYRAFVEVHIEQGPVLDEIDVPLGIVTTINGSVRYSGEVIGMASHAGTTPMDRRKDAAAAVAKLLLFVERRAGLDAKHPAGPSVGTVGILNVPQGSINVVPGRCQFTLDLRAPTNEQRDALALDVEAALQSICERRGVHYHLERTLTADAAPCNPAWQVRWTQAVQSLGLPAHAMPSGAGHDAMKLHQVMPQAMLFVRCGNAGISHNPLETITSDDAQLCVDAFMHLLESL